MKKLYYKLYLKFLGLPHPGQVRRIINRKEPTNQLKRQVARGYANGLKVERIAADLRITQDRVKQILFAVVRG